MRKPTATTGPRPTKAHDNRVRIIGGRWRGRKLAFPDAAGLRPTGDRIRETLFNWLQGDLPGAQCLDLFAGSGALGFEALSRGAAHCVMVERNAQALRSLETARQLLQTDAAEIINGEALSWLAVASGRFDIVFIDPPFADTALAPTVIAAALDRHALLAPHALLYIEQAASQPLVPPTGFVVHRQQRAGQVSYGLWRRTENNP